MSRSRSPKRHEGGERRSRSPLRRREDRGDRRTKTRHDEEHRRKRQRKRSRTGDADRKKTRVELPFDARLLSKADYGPFLPLFAYYLDLQKDKDLSEMDEREARGRWKSFLKKWNNGELSRGWYDPEMYATAQERMGDIAPLGEPGRSRDMGADVDDRAIPELQRHERGSSMSDDEEDDDGMGPTLPPTTRSNAQKSGPGIPNLDELAAIRAARAEEARETRDEEYANLRHARTEDRKLQKERLDELAPRAEPGSRERRLEKKAAVNEKMRGFRDKSPGGDAAVGDGELMGGGDGIDVFKREKAANERRKTEREIRREEIARAKAAEREERVKEWKEREEGTMKALKELAKQRFG